MPWARAMERLAPVARMEEPSSVPKNQYSTAMVTTTKMPRGSRGFCSPSSRIYREETSRWFLSTLTASVAFVPLSAPQPTQPMMRRLMEYSASWVKMPDKMAGMPQAVWNRPVTRPASMPASTAHTRAVAGLAPLTVKRAHTAPPVAREPSTVRSATSRIL